MLTKGGRVKCRPCENAYQLAYYHAHREVTRERKRLDMARRRSTPHLREKLLESQRKSYENRGREAQRERYSKEKVAIWPWRSRLARRWNPALTPDVLEGIWNAQDGLCALTGRPLGRDAQLDHIIPQARGGSHAVSNLRWVCAEANAAKRDRTDEEFVALCESVIEWIGRRIMAVAR